VVLQARRQPRLGDGNADKGVEPRFGFTVTKRVGNAVIRNRVKRRLREATRKLAPRFALTGFDYVLIGRITTVDRKFSDIMRDLEDAFKVVHKDAL
jgi:ribonuclease P protein component